MRKRKRQKHKPVTVGFYSLGCPKNTVDSERMLAEIAQAGMMITTEPESADVVVVNTCGFIAPAKKEALETIKYAVDCKKRGGVKKVIVAGCLAQREGRGLFAEIEGVDAVVGLGQRDDIARIVRRVYKGSKRGAFLEHSCEAISDDRARLRIGPNHWAYLRVSEGCDHSCAFCTIPMIKGKFCSKPPEQIIDEAEELVKAGAVELNIIAQDTAYYGKDLKIKDGLAELVRKIEQIDNLAWIRLMYLYPVGVSEGLIEAVAGSEKIVNYFDVPIQHINDFILKEMCRPDSKERIRRLIEKLRSAIPDCVLRTTLIVGLPGESDERFAELIDFVKWAKFDALGCFKYYPEAGTAAAEMAGQVPEEVKQQRVEQLMLVQQEIAFEKNKSRVGGTLTCLVDTAEKSGSGEGRFYGQAPEIDSICIIEGCKARPGDFIKVRVVGSKDYDLVVEQI